MNEKEFCNLANAHFIAGRYPEAIADYESAIAIKPDFALAFSNMAEAFRLSGQRDKAIIACQNAIRLDPNFPNPWNNLGILMRESGRFDAAIESYRRAIAIHPRYASAYHNLGNALRDSNRRQDAIDAYQKALELNPDLPEAWNALGIMRAWQFKFDLAIEHYQRAISIQPDYAEAHWNLAHALLLIGEFARGWPEYEWRWRVKSLHAPRQYEKPAWNGEDLAGKTILLHTEQGFGDAIHFIRYAPLIAARGAKVLVECHPELVRLIATCAGVQKVFADGNPLDSFDFQCTLLSLPHIFKTDLHSIPSDVPYLRAASKFTTKSNRRKVGLAWAGRPQHHDDRNRSIPISAFAPLAGLAAFYSLQIGPAGKVPAPAELKLIDLTEQLTDFADTASLLAELDLIISVDTSVAHLAGALGKRVWLLLPQLPDWRWMLDRADSPWYPTMRIYRQESPESWDEVIGRVRDELSIFGQTS